MLQKRSLSLASHRTSLALEPEFWATLEHISKHRSLSLSALIAEIDQSRTPDAGLAQAARVYALTWFRDRVDAAPTSQDLA